jgi:signal transduction histidine kinase
MTREAKIARTGTIGNVAVARAACGFRLRAGGPGVPAKWRGWYSVRRLPFPRQGGYHTAPMGLRLRVLLLVILPMALVVGVYGVVRVRLETRDAIDSERRQAAIAANAVRIAVEHTLRTREFADAQHLVSELVVDHPEINGIIVVDRSLRPLALEPRAALSPDRARDLGNVIANGRAVERTDAPTAIRYVLPLRGRDERVEGAMEITFFTHQHEKSLARVAQDVGLRLGVLVIALGVLTSLALRRQIIQPLRRLAASIRALGEGRPGPPLPAERRDELGDVAGAFNRMVEQLQSARAALAAETEHALSLERQLRRAEILAVAGKLTSALAHEVGTPLNIISGRAELALRTVGPDHPAHDELVTIVAQSERISGIIRSLLDSVRMQRPEVREVAVAPLVTQLNRLMSYDATCRGVKFEARVPDDLPSVAADPGQLQQVLLSLLVNAFDATPAGGHVGIEGAARDDHDRSGIAIAVSDTGPGIPAESRDRIFDPFFTTKPPGRGTGLGLAISRDIVREHGGTLTVQSGEGRGATFTVWLPVYREG